MKPNSSWSLREKDQAAPKSHSLHSAGGGPGAGRSGAQTALVERRVIWFVYRAEQHRADVAEIAAGLKLEMADVKELTKSMLRKSLLRELPKTAERPNAQFAVSPRLIQEAAALAAGADPAEL